VFISIHPSTALQPYIENIWYCNRHVPKEEATLSLPFGRSEMVINLSGEYSTGSNKFNEGDYWISGQLTKPTKTHIYGHHECLGVVFTPLGLNAFSNIEASELTNRCVSSNDIFGNKLHSVVDEIKTLSSGEDKIQKLSNSLLRSIISQGESTLIKGALYIIESSEKKSKVTIELLCQQLKTSRKSLNKHFQKYIGLSASVYLQQRAFNGVIRDLSHSPNCRLIEVGYDYNFFDQSHFIKQFQLISGLTPKQYVHLVKNKAVDKSYPNFIIC
jgi:AraC-like DNA-binding protein